MLKERGTPLVLGLRDVMDEPSLLAPEWKRKNVMPALENLYDEIWVYGLPQICDPLAEIDFVVAGTSENGLYRLSGARRCARRLRRCRARCSV